MADAYKLWHGALANMPRLSRYTLGARIDGLFLDVSEFAVQATYAARDQKRVLVVQANNTLDALNFFLKLAWEMKLVDNKKYLAISAPLTEVGRMLGGWKKQLGIGETPVS